MFTLSGGEPLMQHRFAVKLLAAAKKMGIHTTIETNGYYGDKLNDAELETIDLVMLGIKTWDPARHQRHVDFCGRGLNGHVVGSLRCGPQVCRVEYAFRGRMPSERRQRNQMRARGTPKVLARRGVPHSIDVRRPFLERLEGADDVVAFEVVIPPYSPTEGA